MKQEDRDLLVVGVFLFFYGVVLCLVMKRAEEQYNAPQPQPTATQKEKSAPAPINTQIHLLLQPGIAPISQKDIIMEEGPTPGMSNIINTTFLMAQGENYIEITYDPAGNVIRRRLLGPDLRPLNQEEAEQHKSPSD